MTGKIVATSLIVLASSGEASARAGVPPASSYGGPPAPAPGASPPSPSAAPPEGVLERFPFGVELHLGLGPPAGWVGMSAEWSPHPRVALAFGGGAGIDGPQLAFTPRIRPVLSSNEKRSLALELGGGVSAGRYVDSDFELFGSGGETVWDPAIWGNAELGLAAYWASGFRLRFFVGVGAILNLEDGQCDGGCGDGDVAWPYLAFAFGTNFSGFGSSGGVARGL